MTTLYLKDLEKSYSNRQVVNSVSLNVKSGEVVGLLGPNGAGKTTTFYMTIGLVRPDKGKVLLDDEDITDLPHVPKGPQRRRLSSTGDFNIPQTDGQTEFNGDS